MRRHAAALLAATAALAAWLGITQAGALLLATSWAACAAVAWLDPEANPNANRGHRAGAHGYSDDPLQPCENSVEALAALVAADSGPHGQLPDLQVVI